MENKMLKIEWKNATRHKKKLDNKSNYQKSPKSNFELTPKFH